MTSNITQRMYNESIKHSINGILKEEFRAKRVSCTKNIPGKRAINFCLMEPMDRFRIDVFRRAFDQIVTSINERFQLI